MTIDRQELVEELLLRENIRKAIKVVLKKKEDSKIEKVTDEKLNKLLTEEVMDYWLGDATNKQARINLFYECKHDSEVLKNVLDYWRSAE